MICLGNKIIDRVFLGTKEITKIIFGDKNYLPYILTDINNITLNGDGSEQILIISTNSNFQIN